MKCSANPTQKLFLAVRMGELFWASVLHISYDGTAQANFNKNLYKSCDNPLLSIVQHVVPLTIGYCCISNVVVRTHFACLCGRPPISVKLRYAT